VAAGDPGAAGQAGHRQGERDPAAADRDGDREAGDTLSGIAAAHKLTLAALVALPENARYRANPGLIHTGDIVRVK
jgi:hypothetical protein